MHTTVCQQAAATSILLYTLTGHTERVRSMTNTKQAISPLLRLILYYVHPQAHHVDLKLATALMLCS